MKKLGLLLSIVGVFAVAAIAKVGEKNIVDTAVSAGKFNTLAKLLTDTGLDETLRGKGPFTVFAPTDEAFAKLPKATLDALANDKEALKKVLLYHVIVGQKIESKAALAMRGKSAETASKAKIKLSGKGTTLKINDSKVIAADVKASNGVIHVIDTVLIPPMK
jgi:uncharacterized surface protein with fasciclin (FAS1) repeats